MPNKARKHMEWKAIINRIQLNYIHHVLLAEITVTDKYECNNGAKCKWLRNVSHLHPYKDEYVSYIFTHRRNKCLQHKTTCFNDAKCENIPIISEI